MQLLGECVRGAEGALTRPPFGAGIGADMFSLFHFYIVLISTLNIEVIFYLT